jgi:hypothetical protein
MKELECHISGLGGQMDQFIGTQPENERLGLALLLDLGPVCRPGRSIAELESNLRLGDLFTFVVPTGSRRGRLALDLAEKVGDALHEVNRDWRLLSREARQRCLPASHLDFVTLPNGVPYLARKVRQFAKPRRCPFGQALIGEQVESFLVRPEKRDQLLPERLANVVSKGGKDALFQGDHGSLLFSTTIFDWEGLNGIIRD